MLTRISFFIWIVISSWNLHAAVIQPQDSNQGKALYQKLFDIGELISDINSSSKIQENFQFILKKSNYRDNPLLFAGFILAFVIILFTRFANPELFNDIFLSVIKGSHLLNTYHKKHFILLINNGLLDIIFISVLSLYFFNFLSFYEHFSFLLVMMIITGFYFIHILLVFLFYNIFFGAEFFNIHLRNLLTFNRAMGIALLPMMFILNYMNESNQFISYKIISILILLFLLFRTFRIYYLIKRSYQFNSFYIILYLCVFEISLYIVLIKEFGWFINLKA